MDAGNYGSGFADPQSAEDRVAGSTVPQAPTITPPDTKAGIAVRFGLAVVPRGRLVVAAIHPDRPGAEGRTFDMPADWAVFLAWVEAREGSHNLHFTPNEPVPVWQQTGEHGRPKDSDFIAWRAIVTDIDPPANVEERSGGLAGWRKETERGLSKLADDPNGPSALIDSGGGYQLFWMLRDPLPSSPENNAAAQAQSLGLAERFGGDATHNIGHLFRLPGPDNLPNETKRRRGRVQAPTWGLVFNDPRRLHTLAGLAAIAPPIFREDALADALPFDTEPAWQAAGNPDALPDDIAERIADARARDGRLERLLSEPAPEAGSRKRSDHDFHLACVALEAGLTERADVAAVVAARGSNKYAERSEERGHALADKYLVDTINKALARVAKNAAKDAALLSPVTDTDDTASAASGEASAGAFGDGAPLDIFGDDDPGDLSTPPVGSLPDVVAPFVQTIAVQMGVPESFVAVSAVAALAGTIGNALTLRVREYSDGFCVPASIAVVILAGPGRKKSPTTKAVLAPVRALDRDLHRASGAQRVAWRAMHCTPKGTPKPGAPPQPPERQIIVDDATLEKQVRIHADNPTGIIRAPDELSAFLGSMDAYKRNGGGDRGALLRMFDGGPYILDRVSTGKYHAENALMGLIASTQPDKIRALARDLGSDGFLQRLIFVMDDGVEREPLDAPADSDAAAEYARAVRGMFDIRTAGGGTVLLSPEARTILSATWRQIRTLSAIPGASAAWEGHVSKWEGFLYRIALTFHALDTWMVLDTVPVGPGVPVTAETARRASRFALFLMRHALRFYGEFYEPAEHHTEAREIAGYLLAHPDILSVTPRDIEKVRRPLQGERRRTLAAMGALEAAGWASVDARGAEGPTRWAINPHIHARFAERAEREKAQRAAAQRRISAAMSARRGLRDDL